MLNFSTVHDAIVSNVERIPKCYFRIQDFPIKNTVMRQHINLKKQILFSWFPGQGSLQIRNHLFICCMTVDCLMSVCLLCMSNTQNVFFFSFLSFPLFVEIIEPTTSSPVTSPGQYPHTFTKYVWVLFSIKQDLHTVIEIN